MARQSDSGDAQNTSAEVVSTRTNARANADRLARGWLIMLAMLMAAVAMQNFAG